MNQILVSSNIAVVKSFINIMINATATIRRAGNIQVSRELDCHIRRLIDILGAVIGLLISSILFLVLPVLIKLDSPGPVFYTQLRVGQNRRRKARRNVARKIGQERRRSERRVNPSCGKLFVIYKFRTMKMDAEKKCGPVLASENDPRVTAVGKILRATHLDNLPQLINILKGDMSFVGPKPERPYFANQFAAQIPGYVDRFFVRPGLTGMAQIKVDDHKNSLQGTIKKLDYDLSYCRDGNLKSYLRIILISIFKVLFRQSKG